MTKEKQEVYSKILINELKIAIGCTEPVCVAYIAAKARSILNEEPKKIVLKCSTNIVKNVKSVVVPNTNGLKGLEIAGTLGALSGNAEKILQVLDGINAEDIEKAQLFIKNGFCEVELLNSPHNLHVIVEARTDTNCAIVEIKNSHSNIVRIEKDDKVVFENTEDEKKGGSAEKDVKKQMNIEEIYNYVLSVDVTDISAVIEDQIDFNTKVAHAGLNDEYGMQIGSQIIKHNEDSTKTKARAYTAAASDARMGGCSLPVVINSGSGNQGITVSLPVIVYAESLNISREKLIRALALSNLISIYIKSKIGALSAYCGAVSASCGSGSAITYLKNGTYEQICNTIINILANVSGIICDGAKASCAAKIASSVDAAILAHELAMGGKVFADGDGLVSTDINKTIDNFCKVARDGMKQTDVEICDIMIQN